VRVSRLLSFPASDLLCRMPAPSFRFTFYSTFFQPTTDIMPLVQGSPEPMNASPHHAKVRLTTTLSDPLYVAGTHVSGKLEMECRADKGLGIGVIMVELFAVQGPLNHLQIGIRLMNLQQN